MPLISADAIFWFGDGFHSGIAAIRAAFEATWAQLADEAYWIDDLHWLAVDAGAAACIYQFHWQAAVGVARLTRGMVVGRRFSCVATMAGKFCMSISARNPAVP